MPVGIGGVTTAVKGNPIRPPDKGAFPLDHLGECKKIMQRYLDCMKEHKQAHVHCRGLTKEYLNCRMDKDLMAKEDINKFGLDDTIDLKRSEEATAEWNAKKQTKYEGGFVAGYHRSKKTDLPPS